MDALKLEYQKKLEDRNIGTIFLKVMDKLIQYYGVLCNHQKEAMDVIEKLKTLQSFRTFEDATKSRPEVSNLGILDFLSKPFQRMLKYPLILESLVKVTDSDHPDYENIQKSIRSLHEEVARINKEKAKADDLKKMYELNQLIEEVPSYFKLLIPSRICILEGILQKISGKNDQERYFFLFNDCIMYCKRKGKKYTFRGLIYLNQLELDEMKEDPCSFKLFRSDKNLSYVVYGETTQQKNKWVTEIRAQQNKLLGSSRSLSQATLRDHHNNIHNGSAPSHTEKKEPVKVFLDRNTFKTLRIGEETTTHDLVIECHRKMRMENIFPPGIEASSCRIMVHLANSGQKDIGLRPEEKPLQFLRSLEKRGIKSFGTPENHFRIELMHAGALNLSSPSSSPSLSPTSSPPSSSDWHSITYVPSSHSSSRSTFRGSTELDSNPLAHTYTPGVNNYSSNNNSKENPMAATLGGTPSQPIIIGNKKGYLERSTSSLGLQNQATPEKDNSHNTDHNIEENTTTISSPQKERKGITSLFAPKKKLEKSSTQPSTLKISNKETVSSQTKKENIHR